MLEVERQARNEAGAEHQDEQQQVESEPQHHLEARDHVDRIEDDAVADAHDDAKGLDLHPQRVVDPLQGQRDEQDQQRGAGDERHQAVAPERGVHQWPQSFFFGVEAMFARWSL